ncbi:GDSL-type esterase/lipase family protein [Oribacterium sp. WCC10]|uniref:GDSL-type esterase/lipase family protein n=1 Tax=Oribacterium sp. WCC10 TaxID=1855343 RepID=UPI0008E90F8D|nr:GDSL-type esterase/lipase family protein [Oribacterium sp. WCC10]SFG16552.1 GDSL-like Lipase/Acylhydrolase family protein [Oribacterium sp. WCC10]
MRGMRKLAMLALSTAIITNAGISSLAATTGASGIDLDTYQSGQFGPGVGGDSVQSEASATSEASAAADAAYAAQVAQASLGTYVSSSGAVIIGPVSAIDTSNLTEEQNQALDHLFQNSVIIGNSIGNGFALYTKKHAEDPVLKNFQALTANGYYIEGAFDSISTTSRHPFYRGQQRFVWDSVQLMGAKHVFLSFGTTEVQYPDVIEDYQKLIDQIVAVNPDVDITIFSATYIYPGKYYGTMTSPNVKKFNTTMEQVCAARGWNFINVADRLKDENGDLNPVYSSDEYIHQNDQAYDIWTAALKEYGLKKLGLV